MREHYLSHGKPSVVSLYTELTSLKKSHDECVTDYMLRAETAATLLKTAGEMISDSLLVAMVLKGLPLEFKPFCTVVTQKDKALTFSEFKVALRSFAETEKCQQTESTTDDSVMKVDKSSNKFGDRARGSDRFGNHTNSGNRFGYHSNRKNITCFACGLPGHKSKRCRNKKKERVSTLKSDSGEHFCFKVTEVDGPCDVKGLLVDTGATTRIIADESKFVRFDENFKPEKHYIELADGSRTNNIALKKGDARVTSYDSDGNSHEAILENALYAPSFKQDIFSVQAATEKGASIRFMPDTAELVSPNGKQ